MSFVGQATIVLAAAVVAVPLFKRLGLGAILGYLAAGALLGPHAFGAVADVDSVLHFSELGVVFFLFLVGIELEPGHAGVGETEFAAPRAQARRDTGMCR